LILILIELKKKFSLGISFKIYLISFLKLN
jgi:hypothetical protein